MPFSFFYFGLLLSAVSASSQAAVEWKNPEEFCSLHKQFLREQVNARISPDALVATIAKRSPEVVLVGENHSEQNNHYYPVLLKKLRAAMPRLDCVTLEVMESNRVTVQSWTELATEAALQGIPVFKVDGCDISLARKDDWVCLDGRNLTMARKINGLLESGLCHGILHIGGAQHLQKTQPHGNPDLATRLENFQHRTFRIRLMEPATDTYSWDWTETSANRLVCAERAGVIPENFAFLTEGKKLAAQVPVYSRNDTFIQSGAWSDFDAALVLGCPHTGADHCDLAPVPGYINNI
ncbi:MAG: hypothetical protein ACXWQO_18030 [Bdellovibrionota bacterium]